MNIIKAKFWIYNFFTYVATGGLIYIWPRDMACIICVVSVLFTLITSAYAYKHERGRSLRIQYISFLTVLFLVSAYLTSSNSFYNHVITYISVYSLFATLSMLLSAGIMRMLLGPSCENTQSAQSGFTTPETVPVQQPEERKDTSASKPENLKSKKPDLAQTLSKNDIDNLKAQLKENEQAKLDLTKQLCEEKRKTHEFEKKYIDLGIKLKEKEKTIIELRDTVKQLSLKKEEYGNRFKTDNSGLKFKLSEKRKMILQLQKKIRSMEKELASYNNDRYTIQLKTEDK